MSANALFRPTFADLRAEIARRAAHDSSIEDIDALIKQFLLAGGDAAAPCVEYDGTVTWLYRDELAEHVSVVGDLLGYDVARTRMTRLPGCDLFALTMQLPLDARLAYAFVVDRGGTTDWRDRHIVDPLNPKRILVTSPLHALSVLEMPNARPVPELDGLDSDEETSLVYQVVGSADSRIWARVWVYLPPDYDPNERRYPTLYLDNGESYLLSARVAQMMDALLAQSELAPAIVVFIDRADARPESDEHLDAQYVRFLADDLVSWIDARFATSTDPQERVIGGADAHGTLSIYAALERPDVFGRVLAQSPSARTFVRRVPTMLSRNASRGFRPPQCYIDVGRYEGPARVETVHALCATLLNSGAAVSYQDFGGYRGFLGWRTTLPDALRFHFGAPPIQYEL